MRKLNVDKNTAKWANGVRQSELITIVRMAAPQMIT